MRLNLKDVALIAILSTILFVQEEILYILPNISLTVFLMVLYSKKLGLFKTSMIITIYCLLDNLIMNSFNIIFTPVMLIGWLLIPLFVCKLFKSTDEPLRLALIGALLSFIYCWLFIIPSVLIYRMDLIVYITSDVIFELLLASSSFVSIFFLYTPCSKAFDLLLRKNHY